MTDKKDKPIDADVKYGAVMVMPTAETPPEALKDLPKTVFRMPASDESHVDRIKKSKRTTELS